MTRSMRRTVTLDAEVVSCFDQDEDSLSSIVDRLMRAELERRARRAADEERRRIRSEG